MARKIYYKIIDDGRNRIDDAEWENILRLQHWYNSEFMWTAGRIAFKMYAVFPNFEAHHIAPEELQRLIAERRSELQAQGLSENKTIELLEREGLIITHKGGYFDQCLASGFTRVAGNEFNAYLVCEFLLKASHIARQASIEVYDEGMFIKTKRIRFREGGAVVPVRDEGQRRLTESMIAEHHIFAIVDEMKYERFPNFRSTIQDFNDLSIDERLSIVKDWNWLGFENNFDINGDDLRGYDLNRKTASFSIEPPEGKA